MTAAETASPAALAAIGFVIDRCEGGASIVTDSGGLTRFGISARSYPLLDIAHLTRAAAEDIYLADYWQPIRGDDLEPGLALLLLDAAVNQGVQTAVRYLQRILCVDDDGQMGAKTIGAARRYLPPSELRAQYASMRIRAYYELTRTKPIYTRYLNGWIARVHRVLDEAGRVGRQ